MSQYIYLDDNNYTVQTTCERCGFVFSFPSRYLNRNYDASLCQNCKATPVASIRTKAGTCHPWSGDIDLDTLQPIKANGKPHMPGVRLCGNADCCTRSHVVSA